MTSEIPIKRFYNLVRKRHLRRNDRRRRDNIKMDAKGISGSMSTAFILAQNTVLKICVPWKVKNFVINRPHITLSRALQCDVC